MKMFIRSGESVGLEPTTNTTQDLSTANRPNIIAVQTEMVRNKRMDKSKKSKKTRASEPEHISHQVCFMGVQLVIRSRYSKIFSLIKFFYYFSLRLYSHETNLSLLNSSLLLITAVLPLNRLELIKFFNYFSLQLYSH